MNVAPKTKKYSGFRIPRRRPYQQLVRKKKARLDAWPKPLWEVLPNRKLDLVHPHEVIRHVAVAIHLKCGVEFVGARRLRPVVAIHRLPCPIDGHSDKVGMAVGCPG